MKLFKKVTAVSMALVLGAALFGGCAPENDETTFTVGFDKGFPPMGYVEDGEYVGFDLDLAAEVAARRGWKIKLQPIDWNSKDHELETGTIDCVWNGFTKNAERLGEYTWTDAYMNNNQIVIVKTDSDYNSFADLQGKKIAVQKDSSALAAIEHNSAFNTLISSKVETDDNLKAFSELEIGAVDAVVVDECVARYTIEKKGSKFRVLDEVVGQEEFAIGFKLGNDELRDQVQETLLEMVNDGKMDEISTKWFGKDITTLGK